MPFHPYEETSGVVPTYYFPSQANDAAWKVEPRKQVWLPGFRTHVWIGVVVMLVVVNSHPSLRSTVGMMGLVLLGAFLFVYDAWPRRDS